MKKIVAAALAVAALLTGCVATPSFTASSVISGQDHVWDIAFAGNTLLFTERAGRINAIVNGQKRVLYSVPDVVTGGESGVLGLAVDPQFATTRQIFVCLASSLPTTGTGNDVRLVRFQVNADFTALTNRTDIVTGMPHNGTRHYGCRPRFSPAGSLVVGTGDAGIGTAPQSLSSLGGKVLRVDNNGNGLAGNVSGRIYSYGHRNVQGVAFRASDGLGVTTEHGPDKDDELNKIVTGNFGWNPVPGYNEAVPMTDKNLYPNAVDALITSGPDQTRAPSGATFISGAQWGPWNGKLLVAMLKQQEIISLALDSSGTVTDTGAALDNAYGRLRVVTQGPDGNIYIGTDNGNDQIIKLTPNQQ